MGRRQRKLKYVPYSVTKSRLANLDDGTWNIPPCPPPPPANVQRLVGTPPEDIRRAIVGFLHEETSRSMRCNFTFSAVGNLITVRTNPEWCEVKASRRIMLYETCVHMMRDTDGSTTVDYSEPDLFEQIERFINLLPNGHEPTRKRLPGSD